MYNLTSQPLRFAGREYCADLSGCFRVPLRELKGLKLSDIPLYLKVIVLELPRCHISNLFLAANADHLPSYPGRSIRPNLFDSHIQFHVGFVTSSLRDHPNIAQLNNLKKIFFGFAVNEGWSDPLPFVYKTNEHGVLEYATSRDAMRSNLTFYQGLEFQKDFLKTEDCFVLDHLLPVVKHFTSVCESFPRVFICYASEDRDIADKLAGFLTEASVDVWYDKHEIHVGDSIVQRISDALARTSHLIVLLSHNSVTKNWVRKEFSSALMRQLADQSITVLPLRLDDCSIPEILRDINYADARESLPIGFDQLLSAILS